ncbi:hypothetical protein [Gaoshiqia sp. Z1-71]|uniref:hypothetical protein n=1 Tax=Gaoshiqia hydrogeniformans TaxID=3290090 RepID=UPI003BF8F854
MGIENKIVTESPIFTAVFPAIFLFVAIAEKKRKYIFAKPFEKRISGGWFFKKVH